MSATKRFPWLAVLGALGLVLVLAAGLFVILGTDGDEKRASSDGTGTSSSKDLRDRLINEGRVELPTTPAAENAAPGQDYTTPVTGVGVEENLTIPANYEADVTDPWKGAAGTIEVYSDAGLTVPVPISILPDQTATADEPRLAITPLKLRRANITREGDQVKGTMVDLGTFWNLNREVYVVQRLTPEGKQRPRPLVTKVQFAAKAPSPEQVTSRITPQGDAELEWSPVDGASEYAIVLQQRRGDLNDTVRVIGRTTDTTWTSADSERCRNAACTQNTAMTLTTVDASMMASVPSLVAQRVDAKLGVVAIVDRQPSVVAPIDFSGLQALPVRSDRTWDQGADLAGRGLAALPSRFLFVSIDGSTRATGASIDRTEVRRKGDTWIVPLRGVGTRLVDPVRIPAAAVDNIDAAVATFNTRAQRDYPKSGLLETNIVIDIDHPTKPAAELPPPSYPVFGSNELTTYIAGQLIAGSETIDVSEFADEPGLPGVQDALDEARYQNPYALAYFDRISVSGDVIHVEHAYAQAERQQRQKAIAAAVKAVVKDKISPGMSVSDKVTALNRYLVDTADYDHAAIAGSPGKYVADVPATFRYAWETDGTLIDRTGVCMSYSYAFHALAEEAGLTSVVVVGDLADGGGHAWNKVKVGDRWRAVDVTWNDPRGPWTAQQGNRYLMIRDAEFTGSALRSEDDLWMADAHIAQFATR